MSWATVSAIVTMRETTRRGETFISENAAKVLSDLFIMETEEEAMNLFDLVFDDDD